MSSEVLKAAVGYSLTGSPGGICQPKVVSFEILLSGAPYISVLWITKCISTACCLTLHFHVTEMAAFLKFHEPTLLASDSSAVFFTFLSHKNEES